MKLSDPKPGMTRVAEVLRLQGSDPAQPDRDPIAVEEPLEIRVVVEERGQLVRHSVAVTMRTPGADQELALGFLLTEGIISSVDQVRRVTQFDGDIENESNILEVHLNEGSHFDPEAFRRLVYTSSSCGICGRASIDRVRQLCEPLPPGPLVGRTVLWSLPETLRSQQSAFEESGGLHAAGLFDVEGKLHALREDVGRHNALDKIIGWMLDEQKVPAGRSLLMVSGRASFELVQKAAQAGIPLLAAVGAPSSLAIELAEELGMTVVGFLRGERCNLYSRPDRVEDQ